MGHVGYGDDADTRDEAWTRTGWSVEHLVSRLVRYFDVG